MKKEVYIHKNEWGILKHILNISADGLICKVLKDRFDSYTNNDCVVCKYSWIIQTRNAYFDLAILDWNLLFGSHNQPTHYGKLIKNTNIKNIIGSLCKNKNLKKDDLRNILLEYIGINLDVYKKFHKELLIYRNKYLAHREHGFIEDPSNKVVYPKTDYFIESFCAVYFLLINILNQYPVFSNDNQDKKLTFLQFDSKASLLNYINSEYADLLDIKSRC